MHELLIKYYYLVIPIVFIFGIIFTIITKVPNKIQSTARIISTKAPILKKYWLFVAPFTLIFIVTYFLILNYSPRENLEINIMIAGHVMAISFAIFIGYLSFLQVVENLTERLRDKGYKRFKNRHYLRARQYYEQAYSINKKDFYALAELLEIYLVLGDYESFDEKINLLEKIRVENHEKIHFFYLNITQFLFRKNLGKAEEKIKECIQLVKKDPRILNKFSWDFADVKKAEAYSNLTGDPQKIMHNLIKYLDEKLEPEDKKKFENGTYIFIPKDKPKAPPVRA